MENALVLNMVKSQNVGVANLLFIRYVLVT